MTSGSAFWPLMTPVRPSPTRGRRHPPTRSLTNGLETGKFRFLRFLTSANTSHIAVTREYARAPRGERAHGSVPRNAGTVTTPSPP
jgi:hypothetical protein